MSLVPGFRPWNLPPVTRLDVPTSLKQYQPHSTRDHEAHPDPHHTPQHPHSHDILLLSSASSSRAHGPRTCLPPSATLRSMRQHSHWQDIWLLLLAMLHELQIRRKSPAHPLPVSVAPLALATQSGSRYKRVVLMVVCVQLHCVDATIGNMKFWEVEDDCGLRGKGCSCVCNGRIPECVDKRGDPW